jgi:hypothetical protein
MINLCTDYLTEIWKKVAGRGVALDQTIVERYMRPYLIVAKSAAADENWTKKEGVSVFVHHREGMACICAQIFFPVRQGKPGLNHSWAMSEVP